ncbi:hypothetical protein A2U01_0002825, partial [Trifolium medium]|nr:hypothetical protein [Trifolium medium]
VNIAPDVQKESSNANSTIELIAYCAFSSSSVTGRPSEDVDSRPISVHSQVLVLHVLLLCHLH